MTLIEIEGRMSCQKNWRWVVLLVDQQSIKQSGQAFILGLCKLCPYSFQALGNSCKYIKPNPRLAFKARASPGFGGRGELVSFEAAAAEGVREGPGYLEDNSP